jgi:hypothetical protein
MSAPDIIILVRQPFRLDEVRPLRDALHAGGAAVWTVLVCLDSELPPDVGMTRKSVDGARPCKTISPVLAERLGLELLSRQALAKYIENADLVIPC